MILLAASVSTAWSADRPPVVWNNETRVDPPGVTHHALDSAAMNRAVGYCVALPPGYERSDARYPVIYFLHGAGGNENSGGVDFPSILNHLVAKGAAPPAICVFPNGGLSRYRDDPATGINVETMITRELIPLIDRDYRTRPGRESRVITGYSMGGGGALRLALVHPELFSAAASWAGSVVSRETGELPPELSIESLRAATEQVRLLMVVGYKDEASYRGHAPFIQALTEAEYPFTYRTLANVPHKLGLYYHLTGEEVVRFLVRDFASVPQS
jgi:endo-1,4-beta-xylanase